MKDNALSLQLYGLEEVAKLELDASKLGDTSGYVLIHWTCDLEQGVNALRVELKCLLEIPILVRGLGSLKHSSYIIVLEL